MASLICGLTAVKMVLDEKPEGAFVLIFASCLMDGADGFIARALKATSAIGSELDSLCDMVNFGVAPALISYIYWSSVYIDDGMFVGDEILWSMCMVYAACCCYRLARYNVSSSCTSSPKRAIMFFDGIPAPIAASYVMLPIGLHVSASALENRFSTAIPDNTWFALLLQTTSFLYSTKSAVMTQLVTTALLATSRVPTFNSKGLQNAKLQGTMLVRTVFYAWVIALLVCLGATWSTVSSSVYEMCMCTLIYGTILHAFTIPVSCFVKFVLL